MQPQRSGPFPYVPINRRPTITWPNGARLALWVIPNVETFPLNEPVPGGTGLAPDVINWAPRDYLVEAGATYVADWINDDQPYLMNVGGQRLCSIPYSGEINDLPQILRAGRSSDEFELMIRRQFDTLYREGAQSGRVMAICLHPFIIGVPHRIGALDAALAYILRHEGAWPASGRRRSDSATSGE